MCGKGEFSFVYTAIMEVLERRQLDTWQSPSYKEAEAGHIHLETTGKHVMNKALRKTGHPGK